MSRVEPRPSNSETADPVAAYGAPWTNRDVQRPAIGWRLAGIPLDVLGRLRRPASTTVLLHHGRCGSSVLNQLLNQHPEIHFDAEVLCTRYRWHQGRTAAELPVQRYRIAPSIRRRWPRAAGRHYGLEVKTFDLPAHGCRDLGAARDLIAACGDRLLTLRRRNLLRRFLSSWTLDAGDPLHLRTDAPPRARRPHRMDLDEPLPSLLPGRTIEDLLEHEERCVLAIEALSAGAALALWYEDDIRDDPTVAYRKVCETMGLEPHPVEIRLRRTNAVPVEGIVENAGELRDRLAATRWAWMMDAD